MKTPDYYSQANNDRWDLQARPWLGWCKECGQKLYDYSEGEFDGYGYTCYECLEKMKREDEEDAAD